MSHDRGCPCGKESWDYDSCEDPQCFKKPMKFPSTELSVDVRNSIGVVVDTLRREGCNFPAGETAFYWELIAHVQSMLTPSKR